MAGVEYLPQYCICNNIPAAVGSESPGQPHEDVRFCLYYSDSDVDEQPTGSENVGDAGN